MKKNVCALVENQFEHSIQDYGVSPDDLLLVAVSAGLDSTVLAHLCSRLNLNFHLVHMNYGLRGEASDADEFFCRALSKKLSRPFHSRDAKNEISLTTPNLQSVARDLRYDWFNKLLAEHHAQWVLTGHHFNDHVETLIHQFLRGGGPDTLTGFFHSRHSVLRPLIGLRKSEILGYAQLQNIEWREDESNAYDHYTRNKIRLSLLPRLKEYNNGLEQSLIDRARALHDVLGFARHAMQRELNERVIIEEGVARIDLIWFRQLPYQELFLRSWLIPVGFSEGDIKSAMQLLHKQRGELRVGKQVLRLSDQSLMLMAAPVPLVVNTKIEMPFRWVGHDIIVEIFDIISGEKRVPWARIDGHWFEGGAILRNWRPSDRFVPSGMTGSKKVGDFLTHLKIPISERARVLVIEKTGEILAVVGYRLSQHVIKVERPDTAVAVFLT